MDWSREKVETNWLENCFKAAQTLMPFAEAAAWQPGFGVGSQRQLWEDTTGTQFLRLF